MGAKKITFICVDVQQYTAMKPVSKVMKLEEQERIEKLYFELASESRLGILRELNRPRWQDE